MKLVWILSFVAFGGLVAAAPRDDQKPIKGVNLKHVLDRFLALIDVEEFTVFILDKLASDPEAQDVLAYLKGPDAKAIVDHLWNDEEYAKLIQWLYENGLSNIYNDINILHILLGWDPVSGPLARLRLSQPNELPSAKSLGSLLEEILEKLPVNLLTSLALELVQTQDEAVMALFQRLRQPGISASWAAFKNLPQTQKLVAELQEGGIDAATFMAMLEGFFGWGKLSLYSIPFIDLKLL